LRREIDLGSALGTSRHKSPVEFSPTRMTERLLVGHLSVTRRTQVVLFSLPLRVDPLRVDFLPAYRAYISSLPGVVDEIKKSRKYPEKEENDKGNPVEILGRNYLVATVLAGNYSEYPGGILL